MTAKFQSGPFELISKMSPSIQAPTKAHQWPKQDLIKYAAFLNFSKNFISSTEDAFSWSFLRKMSIFIQTKNPNQCRIFHKKMMEKHSCLDLLINELRVKIDKFEEWYQLYEPNLRNIKLCLHREATDVEKQPTKKILSTTPENHYGLNIEATFPVKEKDDAFIPTGDFYHQQKSQLNNSQKMSRASRPSFGFEQFMEGQAQRNMSNLNSDHDFFSKRMGNNSVENKISYEKLMSCHSGFINYIGQLKQIYGAQ